MTPKLKAVLVGCGGMAGGWIKAAAQVPDVELVGFVDISEAAARKRASDAGVVDPVVETDLATALKKAQPDIVFDCTIPAAHVTVATTALAHGCHVLGEKPLANTMADARRCLAAAKESGKIFAVIQNRRYDPRIRRVRAFLEAGNIGPVTTVHGDFFLAPHFGGFRETMEHPLVLDMAIHTFDQARYISGADPVAVYCHEWNPAGSWYGHGASAVAIFEMTGGIVFTYRGSWCAAGVPTNWDADWRIIGQKGSAKWDGVDRFEAERVIEPSPAGEFIAPTEAVTWPEEDPNGKRDGHAGLIRELVHCIRTGETPETVGEENIKSLAMVFAAIESVKTGRRVEIASV